MAIQELFFWRHMFFFEIFGVQQTWQWNLTFSQSEINTHTMNVWVNIPYMDAMGYNLQLEDFLLLYMTRSLTCRLCRRKERTPKKIISPTFAGESFLFPKIMAPQTTPIKTTTTKDKALLRVYQSLVSLTKA